MDNITTNNNNIERYECMMDGCESSSDNSYRESSALLDDQIKQEQSDEEYISNLLMEPPPEKRSQIEGPVKQGLAEKEVKLEPLEEEETKPELGPIPETRHVPLISGTAQYFNNAPNVVKKVTLSEMFKPKPAQVFKKFISQTTCFVKAKQPPCITSISALRLARVPKEEQPTKTEDPPRVRVPYVAQSRNGKFRAIEPPKPYNWEARKICNRRCSICQVLKKHVELKNVTIATERLMVLMANVRRGAMTVQLAVESFNKSPKKTYICLIHFTEACELFNEQLDITIPDKLYEAPIPILESFCRTAESIRGDQVTIPQIKQFMMLFLRKYGGQKLEPLFPKISKQSNEELEMETMRVAQHALKKHYDDEEAQKDPILPKQLRQPRKQVLEKDPCPTTVSNEAMKKCVYCQDYKERVEVVRVPTTVEFRDRYICRMHFPPNSFISASDDSIPAIDNLQNLMNIVGAHVPHLEGSVEPKQEIKEEQDVMNGDELIGNDGADNISVDNVSSQADTPSSSTTALSDRSTKKPRYSMDDDNDEIPQKTTYVPFGFKNGIPMKYSKCNKCGREVCAGYVAKMSHVLGHTDIMRFECLVEGCDYKSKTRGNISCHMKRIHESQLNSFENIELSLEQNDELNSMMKECFADSDDNSGDNCQICHQNIGGKGRNSTACRKNHALHHVNFMLYKCMADDCSFKSKTSNSMATHFPSHSTMNNLKVTKIELTAEQELEIEEMLIKCFPNLNRYESAT